MQKDLCTHGIEDDKYDPFFSMKGRPLRVIFLKAIYKLQGDPAAA